MRAHQTSLCHIRFQSSRGCQPRLGAGIVTSPGVSLRAPPVFDTRVSLRAPSSLRYEGQPPGPLQSLIRGSASGPPPFFDTGSASASDTRVSLRAPYGGQPSGPPLVFDTGRTGYDWSGPTDIRAYRSQAPRSRSRMGRVPAPDGPAPHHPVVFNSPCP